MLKSLIYIFFPSVAKYGWIGIVEREVPVMDWMKLETVWSTTNSLSCSDFALTPENLIKYRLSCRKNSWALQEVI